MRPSCVIIGESFQKGDSMSNDTITDDELLSAVKNGSEDALGRLIDRYSAYVYTIVWSVVKSRMCAQDAEQLTAEVFFRLWRSAASVREGKVKSFLARVARNSAIDAVRRTRLLLPLAETVVVPVEGPETEAIKKAEYAALKKAVDGLPEPDRTLFIGHYYLARTSRELAEETGLSVNTVKTKLRRGKERLRRELENGGYYDKKEHL